MLVWLGTAGWQQPCVHVLLLLGMSCCLSLWRTTAATDHGLGFDTEHHEWYVALGRLVLAKADTAIAVQDAA